MNTLFHNNKIVLKGFKVAKDPLSLAQGLMFASKKKLAKGICLQFPSDVLHGAAITMWFCFMKYEILFVNSKFEVVDKVILRTWRLSYLPKDKCKYVFESTVGTFKDIAIGDRVVLNIKNK